MNVRGFFKNVLNPEEQEKSGDVSAQRKSLGGVGMSGLFSGTSRFLDSVQSKKDGIFTDISNKFNAIKVPGEPTTNQTPVSKKRRSKSSGDHDSDGDSSASEYGDKGDCPMYTEAAPTERRLSVESVDSLPENEASQWREEITKLVSSLINQSPTGIENEANFQTYISRHTGRSAFAKELKKQISSNKTVSEPVLKKMAELFSQALDQCNQNDDFSPASQLMHLSFTIFKDAKPITESDPVVQTYLYTLLKDHPIWQSMRFWNAAFFNVFQTERRRQKTSASLDREDALDKEKEAEINVAYILLCKFTWRMFALGIHKEPCIEFLRKRTGEMDIPVDKSKVLFSNITKFYKQNEDA